MPPQYRERLTRFGERHQQSSKRAAALAATAALVGLVVPIGAAKAAANPTIVVNDAGDGGGGCTGGTCTLRGAIELANTQPGDDTIRFSPLPFSAPIVIQSPITVTSPIVIEGGDLILKAGPANNVFLDVSEGGNLTLNNLTLTSPTATGGNGGDSVQSFGQDATAYAINNTSTLTLNNTTITAPTATGGNGGNDVQTFGGNATAYAINNANTLTLNNTTITTPTATGGNGGNGTQSFGGNATAYAINNTSTLTLNNTTITTPTATGGNSGGGTQFLSGSATAYVVSGDGSVSFTGTNTIDATVARTEKAGPLGQATSVTPQANAAGWNNTDVTVEQTWDGMRVVNVASCPTSTTVSADTLANGTVVTSTCEDGKGNKIQASTTVKLDKTAPTVTVTNVADGKAYDADAVPTAGCTTTDTLSGVATEATPVKTGEGPFTVTCTGTDVAGNTASATATYSVKDTQTVTFDNPGAKDFGATPTLTATASSGLPVTLTSTTPTVCTLTDGVLTTVAVGKCKITATQMGNNAFSAAEPVIQEFPINPVVPGAANNITAVAGDTKAVVSFNAPTKTGSAPITGYQVISNPAGGTGSGTASPITVTGLTNGTAYTFTVKACADGCTTSGASNEITPKAPQTITFAEQSAIDFGAAPTLAATASSDLPVTLTSTTPTVCTLSTAGALTTVAAGNCTVAAAQAGNAATLAAETVSRTFAVKATVPGAPTAVTATVDGTNASVSFTPPTNTGGAPATYTVTVIPGGTTFTGTTSPIGVTGLAYGTAYTFTVTATNSAGASAASTASAPVTPVDPNPAPAPAPAPAPVRPPLIIVAPTQTATTTPATTTTVEPAPTTTVAPEPIKIEPIKPEATPAVVVEPSASIESVKPSGNTSIITFQVKGYRYVNAIVHSTPFEAGRFFPDADGTIRGQIVLPVGFETGDHRLELVGPTASGETQTKNISFTVKGVVFEAPDLALTGTNPTDLTITAALTIAAGALILRRNRRKTKSN